MAGDDSQRITWSLAISRSLVNEPTLPDELDDALGPLLTAFDEMNRWWTQQQEEQRQSDEEVESSALAEWNRIARRKSEGNKRACGASRSDCQRNLLKWSVKRRAAVCEHLFSHFPPPDVPNPSAADRERFERERYDDLLKILENTGLREWADPDRADPPNRADLLRDFWEELTTEWRLVTPLARTPRDGSDNSVTPSPGGQLWGSPGGPYHVDGREPPTRTPHQTEEERKAQIDVYEQRERFRKYGIRAARAFGLRRGAAMRLPHDRTLEQLLEGQCWLSWCTRGALEYSDKWVARQCEAAVISASLVALQHRIREVESLALRMVVERRSSAFLCDAKQKRIIPVRLGAVPMVETEARVLTDRDGVASFQLLLRILGSPAGSELREAALVLLTALTYDVESPVEHRVRRILLGVALELLFSDKAGGGGITERVAMSFAHWLPVAQRQDAEKCARLIYDDRSKAAHRYRSSNLGPQDRPRSRTSSDGSSGAKDDAGDVRQEMVASYCRWFVEVLLAQAKWLESKTTECGTLKNETRRRRLGLSISGTPHT